MPDKLNTSPRDGSAIERFRDMGDGTFAVAMVALPAGYSQMVNATSGNVANAVATATMAAVAGQTNYIGGFSITGAGATAALVVLAALTGLSGGTINYVYVASAGAMVGNPTMVVNFPSPIPASAVNTAVSLSLPALGIGNTNAVVTIYGFRL